MKTQFNNIAMTSMLFWFDNKLLTKGEAFTNHASYFWPIDTRYYGYYTYGAPFKQMVIDESISGANIISGVYINNTFKEIGQNYLSGINSTQGQLYFSQSIAGAPTSISGNYAVKDFNIYLTSETEEDLLFETQFQLKPQTYQNPTGLASNSETYPVIYLKYQGGDNEPLAFGGLDKTNVSVRAIVLSDNIFKLDAVISIFRDTARTLVPLIYENEMPFNMFGSCGCHGFNYLQLTANKQADYDYLYIDNVYVSKTNSRLSNSYNKLNPNLFTAFIDFELSQNRYPRQ
jgi:hypothetical protein